MSCQCLCEDMPKAASLTSVHAVGFSLQMYEMKQHIAIKANEEGNLWCHLDYLHPLQNQHLWAKEARDQQEGGLANGGAAGPEHPAAP